MKKNGDNVISRVPCCIAAAVFLGIGCGSTQITNPEAPKGNNWSTRAQGYHNLAVSAGGYSTTTTGELRILDTSKEQSDLKAELQPLRNIADYQFNVNVDRKNAVRVEPLAEEKPAETKGKSSDEILGSELESTTDSEVGDE